MENKKEPKIFGLNTKKINLDLKDKILIGTTSHSDFLKCAEIIQNSKLKRITSYDLPDNYKTDNGKKTYVYCIDNLTSEKMKEIVGKFIEKYEDENLSDVFELIEVFTKKISSNLTLEKLEGDIGEALFIKKCIELGYKDQIFKCCDEKFNSEARIDFELGNQKFEIKTSSIQKQEINITDKQISENPNVVVVLAEFNKNDKNILEIYEEIKNDFGGELPIWLDERYKRYSDETYKELIENLTLNTKVEPHFCFFDKTKLPTLHENLNYSSIIKKITYTLNLQSTNSTNEEFKELLKNKLNK